MTPLERAWERYRATESDIHAWTAVNPQDPLGSGPLDGIPFGAKDILDTVTLPTEYGSPLYKGRTGDREAALITALRKAGAILFGKTETTAFAYFDPAPTRNPRNLAHTPGGSSSGSAAAVAAGVVPFAIGTQTMGSILRPASFCGVVGFKPTFGTLSREGVLSFAPSLDTVGFLGESVAVIAQVWAALGFANDNASSVRFGMPQDLPEVSPEMQAAFRRTSAVLDAEPVKLPFAYTDALAAARLVNDYEGARSFRDRWLQFGPRIGEKLAALVERGLQIPEDAYRDKLQFLHRAREAMNAVFEKTPILLAPAAPGQAPAGFASTGDPIMNAVWTALGVPAISIPMHVGDGLPLGLQMIANRGRDALLLTAAATKPLPLG